MNCNYNGGHGFLPDSYVDHHIWFVYNYTLNHACDCNSDTRFLKTENFEACLETCTLTKNCRFWTFDKTEKTCFLKHDNKIAVQNKNMVSGNSQSASFNFVQNDVEYVSDNRD